MTGSKSGNAGSFKKGDDPRRHKGGSASAERQAWSIRFHEALVKELHPNEAAYILSTAFRAKQSWAVIEVLERLIGKVSQPIEPGDPDKAFILQIVHTNGSNGNGNGDGGNGKEGAAK